MIWSFLNAPRDVRAAPAHIVLQRSAVSNGLGMDRTGSLEQYLHEQIPLSAAMQVSVRSITAESIVLSAPLEPNINHKRTVFGGSAATLGILAAWSLVHLRLVDAGYDCEVVIQSQHMEYDRPITGPFTARSSLADTAAWPMFLKTLARKKRARIEVLSSLAYGDTIAGRFEGRFVAFLRE